MWEYIRKHKIKIGIIFVVSIMIIPMVIDMLYKIGSSVEHPYLSTFDSKDVLSYVGTALSLIGTLFLGIVAFAQNEKANEINERLLRIEESKFIPILALGEKYFDVLFGGDCFFYPINLSDCFIQNIRISRYGFYDMDYKQSNSISSLLENPAPQKEIINIPPRETAELILYAGELADGYFNKKTIVVEFEITTISGDVYKQIMSFRCSEADEWARYKMLDKKTLHIEKVR